MNTDAQAPFPQELLHHVKWVQVLARRLVSDQYLADEIAQETWLAAIKNPPAPEAARSWFWKVLNTQIALAHRVNSARKGREIKAVAQRTDPHVAEGAGHAFERLMLHQQVVAFTMELEEPYRSAVLLRYIEGLEPKGIAERLNVPLNTIQSRLRRGLEKLRERLEREHGSNAAWCEALLVLCLNPVELSALRLSSALSWAKIIGPIACVLIGCSVYFGLALGEAPLANPNDAREVQTAVALNAPMENAAQQGRTPLSPPEITYGSRRIPVGARSADAEPPFTAIGIPPQAARCADASPPESEQLQPGDLVVTSSGAGFESILRTDHQGRHLAQTTSGTGGYWVGNALLPEGGWVCAAVSGEWITTSGLNFFEAGSGRETASFSTPEVIFPGDVAVFSDGTVAVSDRAEPSVRLYQRDGSYRGSIRYAGSAAWGICVDQHDKLWVADPIRQAVLRFEQSGQLISMTELPFLPGDLVTAPDGTFWITDYFAGFAWHMNIEGEVLGRIDSEFKGNSSGIALTPDGILWLSCIQDRTVRGYSGDGALVQEIQCPAGFQPEFLSVQD